MRDKLIELLTDSEINYAQYLYEECDKTIKGDITKQLMKRLEFYADYLLENGVVVPPCKVGDTLWVVWSYTKAHRKSVYPVEVYALRYDNKKNNMRVCVEGDFKIDYCDGYYTHRYQGTFSWENIGKTVFLTREEAEARLKELNDNE